MNKFSMRSLPAAMALSVTLVFAAHAQVSVGAGVGVRTGANANIDSDARANANMGASNSSASASSNTSATVNSDGTVKRAAKRTGHAIQRTGKNVQGAVGDAADATKSGVYRAKDAVGDVAARANRSIQNNLPANTGASGQVNVQGSGAAGGPTGPSR